MRKDSDGGGKEGDRREGTKTGTMQDGKAGETKGGGGIDD